MSDSIIVRDGSARDEVLNAVKFGIRGCKLNTAT